MKDISILIGALFLLLACANLYASDKRKLGTTIIKGNKEAPQILYMVPWQETKSSTKKEEQKLVLHSLFGDLFDPMMPEELDQPMEMGE